MPSGLLRGLFLDFPYLIDSAWRRVDFNINRELDYRPPGAAAPTDRPVWKRPSFWLFALVVMFTGYGPLWEGFCTLLPPPLSKPALYLVALALIAASLALAILIWKEASARIRAYFANPAGGSLKSRKAIVWLGFVGIIVLLCGSLIGGAGANIALARHEPCRDMHFHVEALLQLLACAGAIGAYALAMSRIRGTLQLLAIQAVLLALVFAMVWCLGAGNTEASGLPYRHVFAAVALSVSVLLVAAHWIADGVFRERDVTAQLRDYFSNRLKATELFDVRRPVTLVEGRIVQALVRGALYRPLLLAFPPALVAFMAPPRYLYLVTLLAVVVWGLLLASGSIAIRWELLVRTLERWFLRGTSRAVTLIVVGIAALRIFRVDYVATIVDAAPFGALFGLVAMGYVLSWLVEYWLNRIVGARVLGMLGADKDSSGTRYPGDDVPVDPDPDLRVLIERGGRYLMLHPLGRYMAVGTQTQRPTQAGFNSHELVGLLTRLAGRDSAYSAALLRMVDTYFFLVNLLLVLVFLLFGAYYLVHSRALAVDPVVTTGGTAFPSALKALSAHLVADPASPPRPAVVVVASGGGTRAALYTAHVLEGLHRLGRDRDIVLLSGVSGGGVSLTFFAVEYARLVSGGRADWDRFKRLASDNFIEDVLEGASELRVFGSSPLTLLLAESFNRRLSPQGRWLQFADIAAAPPLILNTTIVAHPVEDSETLKVTLDRAGTPSHPACAEEETPFTLLKGGRLVFTDLGEVGAFPQPRSRIPDVRLPYRVIQDPAIPLAKAAALQANFPPVFPNARVRLADASTGSRCAPRSYFVTDGGAQENLGLVSALFAVQSALRTLADRCEPGKCALRPLHFVLIEASASGYDFTQDRGLSAAISGAKERLTGGLTETLIASSERMYRDVSGTVERFDFHYLALPMVFRSRGGFGTHWMQAKSITVSDPRERTAPWIRTFGIGTESLGRDAVGELWNELHSVPPSFCDGVRAGAPSARAREKVREWICIDGSGTQMPRDLHIGEWKGLVERLR